LIGRGKEGEGIEEHKAVRLLPPSSAPENGTGSGKKKLRGEGGGGNSSTLIPSGKKKKTGQKKRETVSARIENDAREGFGKQRKPVGD